MSVQLARRPITVEEYYRMAEVGILTEKDHVELIHGEIIEMSPIGSKHAAVVNRITNVLKRLLGDRVIISCQNPIRINSLNHPEPDIVLLKPKEDYYSTGHPEGTDTLLVIEVSDTTYQYDKNIKLPIYASGLVPEFWLVNLEKNEIEIHHAPASDVYKKIEIIRPGDNITLDQFQITVGAERLLG